MLFLLRDKLFPLLVFLQSVICGCAQDQDGRGDFSSVTRAYKVKAAGRLQKGVIVESSGFALADAQGNLWTHGDGGSAAALYKISPQGELLQKMDLPLVNIDWEDLARDDEGRLYIGDFGNNQNKRRNLVIYRLSGPTLRQVDTIRFRYPDQYEFPPHKSARNFDCEAFYYRQDSLYLFTKNRGKGQWVKQYALPAQPGTYVATLRDSIRINTWITAADLSPNGRTAALLGYGHLYLIERQPGRRLFDGTKSCLPLPHTGQAEALAFLNDSTLIVSNEKGRLYHIRKK